LLEWGSGLRTSNTPEPDHCRTTQQDRRISWQTPESAVRRGSDRINVVYKTRQTNMAGSRRTTTLNRRGRAPPPARLVHVVAITPIHLPRHTDVDMAPHLYAATATVYHTTPRSTVTLPTARLCTAFIYATPVVRQLRRDIYLQHTFLYLPYAYPTPTLPSAPTFTARCRARTWYITTPTHAPPFTLFGSGCGQQKVLFGGTH